MLARKNSRVSPARLNGNEMTEAVRIRRPCNTTFLQSEAVLEGPPLSITWERVSND